MRLWILLLVAFLAAAVDATQIFYKPLEQVLTRQTPVILAQVRNSRIEASSSTVTVQVEISDVRPIHLQVPSASTLTYSHSNLLERKVDGQTVRVSPIRDGSGLETQLQTGQRYYFLLSPSGNIIIRAEPETSGPAIQKILGN